MYPTTYLKPASVEEAVSQLGANEDAKFLAGGQTLLPTMKQHLAMPSAVIDLKRIAGLSGVSLQGSELIIGATTTHAEVAESPDVRQHVPALADLAALIGDPAVRHMGTIGGSLANNDPAADYPAAVLALGATIVTSAREIAASDFFAGMFATALEEDEVIVAVKFPRTPHAAYEKFRNPASRYAMVGVFVAKTGNTVCVAVTGAGEDGVFRHAGLEEALASSFTPEAVDPVEVSAEGLMSDIHATAAYRAHLVKVMTKRAVKAI